MAESNIDNIGKSDWVPADKAYEYGYSGYAPDDTPNEAYTVAGVTGGTDKVVNAPAEPTRPAPKGK